MTRKVLDSPAMDEENPGGGVFVDGDESVQPPGNSSGKRFAVRTVVVLLVVAATAIGLHFFAHSLSYESTDDAFIDGHVVQVSPKISGRVEAVLIKDNQMVKKGDPIIEIDPRDYDIQLKQKQAALNSITAQVRAAEAAVEQQKANVKSLQATQNQDEADREAAQAKADQAADDLKREEDLYKQHVVSIQDLVHSQETNHSAQASLESARMKVIAAQAQIAEGEAQVRSFEAMQQYVVSQVKENEANVEAATLNDSYAKVFAPESGRITHKSVEPGDYVQVGQNLLALIPSHIWVTANFKENQLRLMRPGQPVEVELDAMGGQKFKAHVDSLQMGSGARFSLLPPENATGNYVKVVQRVPVKIFFDEMPDLASTGLPIGPGESVGVTVKVRDFHYSPLQLLLVGAAAALVIFVILRRIRGRQENSERQMVLDVRTKSSASPLAANR